MEQINNQSLRCGEAFYPNDKISATQLSFSRKKGEWDNFKNLIPLLAEVYF